MKTIKVIAIAIPLLLLAGCKAVDSDQDSKVRISCTQVGSMTTIRVHVASSTPIPAGFAIGLNGNTIDADECTNNGPYTNSAQVSNDRSEAEVVFYLDNNREDYDHYFPSGSTEPASNLMNLTLYSRANCSGTFTNIGEIHDHQITWQPIYANGQSCGITSQITETKVEL